jgi:hypothetical protein
MATTKKAAVAKKGVRKAAKKAPDKVGVQITFDRGPFGNEEKRNKLRDAVRTALEGDQPLSDVLPSKIPNLSADDLKSMDVTKKAVPV